MTTTPKNKKTGIIRWSAIVPLTVLIVITYAYFAFFFDGHMKSLIEWGGYKALGSEVNVGQFKSSFTGGHVEINKIEITNAEQPQLNSLELQSVRFNINWDALLRLKFVVEEMAAEGIQLNSKRSRPGKVAPPPPPDINEGPSFTEQLQGKAVDKITKDYSDNVLGDIASFLKSGDLNAQLKNIEGTLEAKKVAEDLNKKWTDKKQQWDQNIKQLPTEKDINSFKTRFEGIQYKNFKTPQEVESAVNQFNALKKDVDDKVKIVETTKNNLVSDVQAIQTDYQLLDQKIKSDINGLKTRFKIPQLNAGQFAKSLFMSYLTPYTIKLDHYKKMAQKYLPPKYSQMLDGKKNKTEKDDDTIQPHPREKGVTYEFPVEKGYPLFWIQKIKISSQSNAQTDFGDLTGLIQNITSNQRQIGKQTTLDVSGQFKSMNISGIKAFAAFNNIQPTPSAQFNVQVGQYGLQNLDLINSADGSIKIPQSHNSLLIAGSTLGFKSYDISLKNDFKDVKFDISAKEKIVNDILQQTLSTIPSFDLQASIKGEIKNLDVQVSSSLGGQLEKAFGQLLQKKVDEVNAQIKERIDKEIGQIKSQIDSQTLAIKNQYGSEVTKVQNQLESQKKLADDRIQQAKKDLENQAKSKIQQEGQKAVDDLKKKLGF